MEMPLSTLTLGPGLAGFPAFPELPITADTANAALLALGFAFTSTTFRFVLDSAALAPLGLVSPSPFR
jgi:hypothetical protein